MRVVWIEKSLQSANIAASVAVIATAADLTLAGGAGTAISGLLSATSLWKSLARPDRDLAKEMAKIVDDTHLTADRKKIVLANLAAVFPNVKDMVDGLRDSRATASLMAEKLAATKVKDPAYRTPQAMADYKATLAAILAPFLKPMTVEEATQIELLRLTKEQALSDRMRQVGITEATIIDLARRVTSDTTDLGQAWKELQNVIEIAVKVQEEGHTTSNHPDFIDQVLTRASELAAGGNYDDAWKALQNAQQEEREASTARQLKLLDSTENIARLQRNPDRVAEAIAARIEISFPAHAKLPQLVGQMGRHTPEGEVLSSNFEQRISASLGRIILSEDLPAAARGLVLWMIGSAQTETAQNEGDEEGLFAALDTFGQAADFLDPVKSPEPWALLKNSIANIWFLLGDRNNDVERLEKALCFYEGSLNFLDGLSIPVRSWALTRLNWATTLSAIATIQNNPEKLEKAADGYREALARLSPQTSPNDWAKAQSGLGCTLTELGQIMQSERLLNEAREALEHALEITGKDRLEFQWANTQGNLATNEEKLFEVNGNAEHLVKALSHLESAARAFGELGAEHQTSRIQQHKEALEKMINRSRA